MAIEAISSSVPSYALQSYRNHSIDGMQRAQAQTEAAALALSRGEVNAGNMIGMIGGLYSFQANAIAFRTQDEMVGTLLNTYA